MIRHKWFFILESNINERTTISRDTEFSKRFGIAAGGMALIIITMIVLVYIFINMRRRGNTYTEQNKKGILNLVLNYAFFILI